jgi:hypothetical protein
MAAGREQYPKGKGSSLVSVELTLRRWISHDSLESAAPHFAKALGAFPPLLGHNDSVQPQMDTDKNLGERLFQARWDWSLIGAPVFAALKCLRICVHLCPSVVKVWPIPLKTAGTEEKTTPSVR